MTFFTVGNAAVENLTHHTFFQGIGDVPKIALGLPSNELRKLCRYYKMEEKYNHITVLVNPFVTSCISSMPTEIERHEKESSGGNG